jgi:hypothetical protein
MPTEKKKNVRGANKIELYEIRRKAIETLGGRDRYARMAELAKTEFQAFTEQRIRHLRIRDFYYNIDFNFKTCQINLKRCMHELRSIRNSLKEMSTEFTQGDNKEAFVEVQKKINKIAELDKREKILAKTVPILLTEFKRTRARRAEKLQIDMMKGNLLDCEIQ